MIKQQLQLKLSQKLSPQQIQLMKLIQLSTQELEQKIQSEIGENPALENGKEITNAESDSDAYEENQTIDAQDIDIDSYLSDDDIPAYRTQVSNYSADQEEKNIPVSGGISFHQMLSSQLQNLILNEQEEEIATFLVGSIDESGYIRRSVDEIIDDLAFTQNIFIEQETLLRVLKKVQGLDPPGVGARSLQECLQLQLERKQNPSKAVILALNIITKAFNEFSKKHYQKLMDKFGVDEEKLKEVFEIVSKLNPKPGGALANTSQNTHIVPDFIMTIENGQVHVELNRRNAPELRVSNSYKEMFAGYKQAPEKNKSQEEAVLFIKQKLDAAKWFIEAIEQRYNTLLMTINSIVEHQKAYFLSGDEKNLKPMILKDIADKINMDISTISRVANSKYIDTPYGTKLLKSFFSEGMKNEEGEDVSTIEIKKILEQLIESEDKKSPLTDSALSKLLKEKGYPVARRTVAKYREQLEFPVARLRKQI
ncbi:MAG TPA: RNA polymerase sigma-54 factor [Flavobacteriaceae bacterium]|nr:RNA polymerase sigma-54 factor [Flavobacteriaceae bacterium]|tara:strand:- start:2928 stop:4370 length:1443 start_codon:yes stop_codon:yes gene_type:complete